MHIDDETRAALIGALRSIGLADALGGPPADAFDFRPLAGGLGGRAYVASAGARGWVVRLPGDDRAGALGIADEARITAAAATLGIAPQVAAYDADAGVLVTELLRGARPVDAAFLRSAEGTERAAVLLRRLHSLRLPLRPYDPESFAAQYLAGPCAEERLGERQRGLASELRRLARAYRTRFPSIVLCHNDLVAANFVADDRLRLVDFEYAVTAAPVLDLAGLAALNEFDADERWRLVEAYYRGSAVPFTPAELAKVARLVRLIGYFWALRSTAAARDRAPYDDFARRTAESLERED